MSRSFVVLVYSFVLVDCWVLLCGVLWHSQSGSAVVAFLGKCQILGPVGHYCYLTNTVVVYCREIGYFLPLKVGISFSCLISFVDSVFPLEYS